MSRRAAAQGRAAALHNDDLAALHHVGDMDGPKVPHWERVATPLGATGITIHKWVNTKTISIPWRNRFWQIVPFGAPIPTQAQELGPAPAPQALGGDWARGGDGVVPRPTPRRKGPAKQEKSDDSDMDFE